MIEPNKQQDENMMECPVCSGHREVRGAVSKIAWFKCGYCSGTGKVTEKRFHAWQDRSAESPAVNAVNTSEPLTDRIQTEAASSCSDFGETAAGAKLIAAECIKANE